jgi:hypothetical protein
MIDRRAHVISLLSLRAVSSDLAPAHPCWGFFAPIVKKAFGIYKTVWRPHVVRRKPYLAAG